MSDFGGYGALQQEAREIAKTDREKPLIDCPICGEPLELNEKRGLLSCPFGHYRTSRRTRG